MIEVLTSSNGSYPRIGEHPDEQRLRRAYAQLEIGAIAEGRYREIEDAIVAEVIAEQASTGLDIVTDGMVRWSDPISHTARALTGVTINGLLRYFDNNFYFRQPVVRDHIARVRTVARSEYLFAARCTTRPVKSVLTGPYTLARASVIATSSYRGLGDLTASYAAILADEVRDLVAAGALYVQIDEPAILHFPGDIALLADALDPIHAACGNSELLLATYFGDAGPLLERLEELPVDVLALDLVTNPALLDRLAREGSRRRLALGMLDGRTTRMESATVLAPLAEAILAGPLPPGNHYLTTSCGLELLPRPYARRKLDVLDQLRRAVGGNRP